MKPAIHFITLLSLTLLIACGGGEDNPQTVVGKQALLKKKKAELLALNREISQLEEDIAAQDPTAVRQEKAVAISTKVLVPQTFAHYVEVQGRVEANNNIVVSSQSSGRLTDLQVEEGQSVRKGQVLARIDDAVIRRNIEEVKTQLELAEIMYTKQKNLWEKEIGTEVQYLSAKNQKETLERRLETLQEQQDLTVLKASQSGMVDEIFAREGETVAPGQPAMRLINNADLSLVAQLSEAYTPYVRRGKEVEVRFPILERSFSARVKRVGQVIDPTNRTFDVEVALPNSRAYKPNMFGQIAINDRTLEDALVIPQSVIQQSDDGAFVYVVESNSEGQWTARRRVIETGLDHRGQVVVTQGLAPQDRLVMQGYKNLSDGQKVELIEEGIAKK
jgi:membrane fusion protein, multidrug efflux system